MTHDGIVDTVWLSTTDFSREINNQLKETTILDKQTGELFKSFSARKDDLRIYIDGKGLLATFTAPIYAGASDNLKLANKDSLILCAEKLTEDLRKIGIVTSVPVGQLRLSRLDIAKNIEPRCPFVVYEPILANLNIPRTKLYRYPGTVSYRNKLRQIEFYDKRKQLLKKNKSLHLPRDIMRLEIRFMRKEELEKRGLVTLEVLIDEYDNLFDIYDGCIKDIFSYEPSQSDTYDDPILIKAISDAKSVYDVIRVLGTHILVEDVGLNTLGELILRKYSGKCQGRDKNVPKTAV